MSEPGQDGGEAGTTLVELLVAMALLSLVALFALQGIGALRGVTLFAGRMADAEERSAVAAHLRRTLAEAMTLAPDGAELAFEGEGEAMRFLAPADPLLEGGGLVRVTLRAERDRAGVLALVERREPLGRAAGSEPDAVTLLRPIAGLGLFYAEEAAGGGTRWLREWDSGGRGPPVLARIAVDLPGATRPLDLLVHPAARAPASSPAGAVLPAPPT